MSNFKQGKSYKSRNKNLANLGFADYRAYLASPLWAEIRERVFKQHGRLCSLCGKPANQVHHIRYGVDDLTGKRLDFMRPLCGGCHESVEFTDSGRKLTVAKAAKRFKKRKSALQHVRKPRVIADQEKRRRPTTWAPLWRLAKSP